MMRCLFTPGRWPAWWGRVGVIVIALAFCAVALHSIRDEGLVIDELAHVSAGMLYLERQEYIVNPEHPPLLKIIAAIPLVLRGMEYGKPKGPHVNQWEEGRRFFFSLDRDTDGILFSARTAVIIFLTLCLIIVGILLLGLLPPGWALAALFFIVFDPNLLAHARYVTTDAGVALLSLIALLLFLRYCRRPTITAAAALGAALGASLLAKYSGLFTCAFLWGAFVLFCVREFLRRRGAGRLVAQGLIVLLLPLAMAYSVYSWASFRSNTVQLKAMVAAEVEASGPRDTLSEAMEDAWLRPIALYRVGMQHVEKRYRKGAKDRFPQYLDGEFRDAGWWYYYPLALVYKETPSLLALMFGALGLLGYRMMRREPIEAPITLIGGYLVFYLGISMASMLAIGIRHISPVLICLPLFAIFMIASERRWPRLRKSAVGIAVAGQLVSIASIHPFYLAYFNRIAGGPEHGSRHLIDSNLDWGNNLKRLYLWAEENGIAEMAVDYWGPTPLDHYDGGRIFREWHVDSGVPHGYLAVHPMWIVHSRWRKAQGKADIDYGYLEGMEPVARIGYGINVYRFP